MEPRASALTVDGWDDAAAGYDDLMAPVTTPFCEEALRVAGLKAGERVLDVAAGTGALALEAARSGARVVATDFAPMMVERLRAKARAAKLANVEAIVMDGEDLKFSDDAFDAAFSVFGLIFFADRAAGFAEMRRTLKHGGRAVVVGWSAPERVGHVAPVAETLAEMVPDAPDEATSPAHCFADPATLAREMREAGFRDVRVSTARRTLVFPSAAWFADKGQRAVPSGLLVERAPPAFRDAFRARLVERVRARFGDGPVAFESEAHVGFGIK
ncbi:MAG TPA: methyltransferase domain-containing protein [Candidatus Thermoplasmatota archaeon]|nr:methyltransferase domain-containing protein [Candidatus Thermoplasmatota archaeon]